MDGVDTKMRKLAILSMKGKMNGWKKNLGQEERKKKLNLEQKCTPQCVPLTLAFRLWGKTVASAFSWYEIFRFDLEFGRA